MIRAGAAKQRIVLRSPVAENASREAESLLVVQGRDSIAHPVKATE